MTLPIIYVEFKAHLTNNATTAFCSNMQIPSGLCSVGLSFVFQQDNDPKHISRLCNSYLTKKVSDGVLHQMTWPPQSPDLNSIEMVWNKLDRRVKEKQPTSAVENSKNIEKPWNE